MRIRRWEFCQEVNWVWTSQDGLIDIGHKKPPLNA
jgi:hypothetical protein